MTVSADPPSLNQSANTLLEIAGLLHAGRPELAMTGKARNPNCHHAVEVATRNFTEFAHDQYQDVVALLAALSTKLSGVAQGYQTVDDQIKAGMDDFLTKSRYRAGAP